MTAPVPQGNHQRDGLEQMAQSTLRQGVAVHEFLVELMEWLQATTAGVKRRFRARREQVATHVVEGEPGIFPQPVACMLRALGRRKLGRRRPMEQHEEGADHGLPPPGG